MEKVCVFCGQRPDSTSREHVIPRWLIEMTGDPKRTFTLNTLESIRGGGHRSFAADQFVFPACHACNETYGELEGHTKTLVSRLLSGVAISDSDARRLFDWFDKVRVGLWLGMMYLDKNPYHIQPRFHITQRIGASDRSLYLFHLSENMTGLNFFGPETPIFPHMPSAMVLRIGPLLFLNLSCLQMNARRLGFPFFSSIVRDDTGVSYELRAGLGRVIRPVNKFPIPEGFCAVHQTITDPNILELHPQAYESNYVRAHSLDSTRSTTLVEQEGVVRWDAQYSAPQDILSDNNSWRLWRRVVLTAWELQSVLYNDPVTVATAEPDIPNALADTERAVKTRLQRVLLGRARKKGVNDFFGRTGSEIPK